MVGKSEKEIHSIFSNGFCSVLDICSLRFDFETFTTAAPTCTNDNCNCVDSFQITAVSNKYHQNSFCMILTQYCMHRVQVDLQHRSFAEKMLVNTFMLTLVQTLVQVLSLILLLAPQQLLADYLKSKSLRSNVGLRVVPMTLDVCNIILEQLVGSQASILLRHLHQTINICQVKSRFILLSNLLVRPLYI